MNVHTSEIRACDQPPTFSVLDQEDVKLAHHLLKLGEEGGDTVPMKTTNQHGTTWASWQLTDLVLHGCQSSPRGGSYNSRCRFIGLFIMMLPFLYVIETTLWGNSFRTVEVF